MYLIVKSQHRAVYLEGNSTLVEVYNGVESTITLKEFWESDAPNMAKSHLLGMLRDCNPLQDYVLLVAPLFGGKIVLEQGLIYVFFGYIPVVVEKANAYIPQLYEEFSYGEDAVRACEFISILE